MICKSITKFRELRSELATKASKLLTQLINSQESGNENLGNLIQELQIGSGILVYPVIDTNGASELRIISLF